MEAKNNAIEEARKAVKTAKKIIKKERGAVVATPVAQGIETNVYDPSIPLAPVGVAKKMEKTKGIEIGALNPNLPFAVALQIPEKKKKEKREEKRERKDKPKRAPTAYNLFVKDYYSKNKNDLSFTSQSPGARMKMIAAAWQLQKKK